MPATAIPYVFLEPLSWPGMATGGARNSAFGAVRPMSFMDVNLSSDWNAVTPMPGG